MSINTKDFHNRLIATYPRELSLKNVKCNVISDKLVMQSHFSMYIVQEYANIDIHNLDSAVKEFPELYKRFITSYIKKFKEHPTVDLDLLEYNIRFGKNYWEEQERFGKAKETIADKIDKLSKAYKIELFANNLRYDGANIKFTLTIIKENIAFTSKEINIFINNFSEDYNHDNIRTRLNSLVKSHMGLIDKYLDGGDLHV